MTHTPDDLRHLIEHIDGLRAKATKGPWRQDETTIHDERIDAKNIANCGGLQHRLGPGRHITAKYEEYTANASYIVALENAYDKLRSYIVAHPQPSNPSVRSVTEEAIAREPSEEMVAKALAAFYPGQTIHPENQERLRQRMYAALRAAATAPQEGMKPVPVEPSEDSDPLCADKAHIERIRQKVKQSDALGPFWRGILVSALDLIDAQRKLSDTYGLALMMIREGCAEPQKFAGEMLEKGGTTPTPPASPSPAKGRSKDGGT